MEKTWKSYGMIINGLSQHVRYFAQPLDSEKKVTV